MVLLRSFGHLVLILPWLVALASQRTHNYPRRALVAASPNRGQQALLPWHFFSDSPFWLLNYSGTTSRERSARAKTRDSKADDSFAETLLGSSRWFPKIGVLPIIQN